MLQNLADDPTGWSIGRIPQPNDEIRTLYDYRKRHASYRADGDSLLSFGNYAWIVSRPYSPKLLSTTNVLSLYGTIMKSPTKLTVTVSPTRTTLNPAIFNTCLLYTSPSPRD